MKLIVSLWIENMYLIIDKNPSSTVIFIADIRSLSNSGNLHGSFVADIVRTPIPIPSTWDNGRNIHIHVAVIPRTIHNIDGSVFFLLNTVVIVLYLDLKIISTVNIWGSRRFFSFMPNVFGYLTYKGNATYFSQR